MKLYLRRLHYRCSVWRLKRKILRTMTSKKEERAAASAVAAEQLGSMSLGESAERKENETEPATKNGTPSKKMCSACGKKSNALKKCNGCLCVWYCDKECQNKHRREHKKECKRIKVELDKRGGRLNLGTEADLGPLEKLPPREECPICMRVMPIHPKLESHQDCCGKGICGGCELQHMRKNKPSCAFCREPVSDSDEEALARLRKRARQKDPRALLHLSLAYGYGGEYGLQVDHAKCIDLLRESADLGLPSALYQLGHYFNSGDMGLEKDEEEGLKCWKEAADGGDLLSRYNLGNAEENNGDSVAAMRHWRLSASGGRRKSIDALICSFEGGFLHHGDLAETLQAMYRARAEMKSDERSEVIALLKENGEDYDI